MSVEHRATRSKLFLRLTATIVVVSIAGRARNPFVRAEAILGLSPTPLERILHVKCLFCGMTEAVYRLAHADLKGAMAANCLVPLVPIALIIWTVRGSK